MPTPTLQQTTAITTVDRALVVEAGAGTGKTWVLVERYLHLLALHPDWPIESIVAITFTEKAAREMRNRIRSGVETRARQNPHDVHWQERRRRLDQIQVSTIHSLCARILRENAIAAALDPKFDVLDEAAATLLAEDAIRQTLTDLSQNADHPALALFASLSVFDVKNTMSELLSRRGTVAQLFDELADKATLLDRWKTAVEEMLVQRWQQTVAQSAELAEALDYLPSVPIVDASDLLAGAVRLAQDGCRHITAGDHTAGDFAQAVACFAQISRSGGKAANWGGTEGKKYLSAMLAAVQQLGKDWVKDGVTEPVGVLDEAAADNLLGWRSLWQTLTATYDKLKDEQHVLDFDDLEGYTVRLLKQDPPSDRLRAFLDGIHHVMVDEFQDTNPIQRKIVYALAPPQTSGRLFVVGDAKQSIYRFRQAQVSIFNQTAQDVRTITGHDAQPLNQSFRTHQELVNGFNHLFDHVLQPLNGARHQDYEAQPGPLTANRADSPDAPPIELWILPKEDDDGKINAEEGRRWEASLLADRLLALKDSRTLIWDKETGKRRPFEFRDAAILFRATTNLPLYEEVFKQKGLPYLTVSGRGYYDRPEVQHLLSLLSALHNPADDFSLAAVLRAALFGLSDETLFRLRCFDAAGQPIKDVRPLRAALSDPPSTDQDDAVRHAGTVLEELWAQRGRVDVWQLLRLAVDRTGYATALALLDRDGIGGGRQLSNVQKFLSMARESGGANLSDFLRRVSDLRAAEAREGEALGREPESGAVQLMSIHASKGLEFPVVAVADLGREPRNNRSDYILHDPMIGLVCKVRDQNGEWQTPASYNWGRWQIGQMEAAEDKRLLYVACTRAADLLILSGRGDAKSSWLAQLLAAWAIAAEGDETETWDSAIVDPTCDPFRLTIHRPTARPDLDKHTATSPKPTHDGLAHASPLSRPLPPTPASEARTVTRFLREAAQAESLDETGLSLRPAVRPRAGTQPFHPVPRYVVGNIVHRALADWSVLALAPSDLHPVLTGLARSLGVADPRSADDAAARAGRLIANLKDTPLYRQIDGASRRLHEIPFTLSTTQGVLNGVIDLLFEDAAGWHLLDWKTEWARTDEAEAKAAEFLPQLAIYHLAAQRILGLAPWTGVCLLAAGASVHWYEEGVLAEGVGGLVPDARQG